MSECTHQECDWARGQLEADGKRAPPGWCGLDRDIPWWPWAPRRRLAVWPQQEHIYNDWREVDAYRASGDCTCEVCGLLYYDHPNLPGAEELCPTLMLLCRGEVVKV